jgi:predicted TIM-barrel fold metal-dependent hydrolase
MGTDIHFLIPTSWLSTVGLPDPALEVGLIRAYHRHMADFCGQYPTRLKSYFLGDDVLMYASDYPHSECQFPNSVDNILAWSSLGDANKKKLLWDNANRFFKQT